MLYQPVARQDGLPNRVRRQLLDMITAGHLTPGHQLPPERTLAAQFAVSRNVVREALHSLVEMNILYRRQGSGIYVRELDVESLIEPLEFVVTLETATLRALHEARLIIEPGIAALAAERRPDDFQPGLTELLEESACIVDSDPDRFMQIDVDVHAAIVRAAANPFLTRITDSLQALGRNSRQRTNAVVEMRHSAHEDHERIVAAITAGDAGEARSAMLDHLEHVGKTLSRLE